jgi:hypothetical protein
MMCLSVIAVLLQASSRAPLAGWLLPFASRCRLIPLMGIKRRPSYRGLAPHQFMSMPGVHMRLQATHQGGAPIGLPLWWAPEP